MLFLSPADIPHSRQDGTGTMPVINLLVSAPVIFSMFLLSVTVVTIVTIFSLPTHYIKYRHNRHISSRLFPTKVNLIFLPSCPRSVLYWIPYSRINRSRLTFNFRDNAFGCISTCNTSTSSVAVPTHSGVVSVTSSLIFSNRGSSGSFQSSVSVLVSS